MSPERPIALCLALALAARAAVAGPPFLTDDPEPVELGHWEVYAFSTATAVKGDTFGTLPGVEVNYGAAPDLQLHIIAPVAFDSPAGGSTVFGYGDTELGFKYRFIEEDKDGWRPQVGIFPLFEAPTGNFERGLGTGRAHEFFPVWIQKSFGQWLTYGGGGYWHNPGPGNKDFWFAGWLLQRQVTDDLALGGEVFHEAASFAAEPANVVGEHAITGFNLGAIYDFTDNYHLLVSAGRGLSNAPINDAFSYYLAFQWTF